MNKSDKQEFSDLCVSHKALIASQQTLLLSTVSKTNLPEISYAPYIRDQQGVFYIFISELASHTQNLLVNKQAAIMFIKPESETREMFARERVIFHCEVSEIAPQDIVFEKQLCLFQERFGQVVSVIKSLSDFHLFALEPRSGQYVVGFGKAFKIDVKNNRLTRIGKG